MSEIKRSAGLVEGNKWDGGDVMWRAAMVAAEGEERDKKRLRER